MADRIAMNSFCKLKNKRILLVDDDEFIRDSLSLAFMKNGCFLITAKTAEEGLRILKKQGFDVIVSDLKLPGMDGLDFFEQVKTSRLNTLNILITAYGDKDIFSKAFAAGIHDFMEKPFTVSTLTQTLGKLIENRAKRRIVSERI